MLSEDRVRFRLPRDRRFHRALLHRQSLLSLLQPSLHRSVSSILHRTSAVQDSFPLPSLNLSSLPSQVLSRPSMQSQSFADTSVCECISNLSPSSISVHPFLEL